MPVQGPLTSKVMTVMISFQPLRSLKIFLLSAPYIRLPEVMLNPQTLSWLTSVAGDQRMMAVSNRTSLPMAYNSCHLQARVTMHTYHLAAPLWPALPLPVRPYYCRNITHNYIPVRLCIPQH